MVSRITLKDLSLHDFHKVTTERAEMIRKHHQVTKFCGESRWPYTDQLTSDQILLMRDTYAGHRKQPTKLVTKKIYDRVFPKESDWDPRVQRDDRQFIPDLTIPARLEDHHRVVPITSNAVYGKRHMDFYDFNSRSHGRVHIVKSFMSRNNISSLPPLLGLLYKNKPLRPKSYL